MAASRRAGSLAFRSTTAIPADRLPTGTTNAPAAIASPGYGRRIGGRSSIFRVAARATETRLQYAGSMTTPTTDATLLIRTRCPHCAAVAESLLRLSKRGQVARLEIINLDQRPEQGQTRGVRSVPWLQLGPFELVGAHGFDELQAWADHAAAGTGWIDYLLYLLSQHQLPQVVARLQAEPHQLRALLDRMADEQLEMGARIGISAVVEELADTELLRACVPQLSELTLSPSPQIRADACHFLGLAGDPQAAAAVRRLLGDEQEDVREIAVETLAVLDGGTDAQERQS